MSDDLDLSIPSHPGLYRVPRRSGASDPATRRLLFMAGGLGGALLIGLVMWSTFAHHRSAVVPVIEADSRPLRVKPENPGGLQVAGQDSAILSGDGAGEAESLGPPPETPAPQQLQAQQSAKPGDAAAEKPASAPPAASPPTPHVTSPSAPQAAVPPAPAPAAKPAAAPAPAVKPADVGTRVTLVQLAALESEAAATAEWQRLAKKMPDLFGAKKPAISKVDRDGRTFWRLRTGGFADVAQATRFCQDVRTKGGGCAIASF